jgi:hypothetical protein
MFCILRWAKNQLYEDLWFEVCPFLRREVSVLEGGVYDLKMQECIDKDAEHSEWISETHSTQRCT